MHPVLKTEISYIPLHPDAQALETLRRMRNMAWASQAKPEIQATVSEIKSKSDSKESYVQNVYEYVKAHIQFELDAPIAERLIGQHAVEVLVWPEEFIKGTVKSGDCDDFSLLICTLLAANDIPCGFVVIEEQGRGQLSHVYAYAKLNDHIVPLDASHGLHVGWEYPHAARKEYCEVLESTSDKLINWGIIGAAGYLLYRYSKSKRVITL